MLVFISVFFIAPFPYLDIEWKIFDGDDVRDVTLMLEIFQNENKILFGCYLDIEGKIFDGDVAGRLEHTVAQPSHLY